MVYKGKYQSKMDENWGYPYLWTAPDSSLEALCAFMIEASEKRSLDDDDPALDWRTPVARPLAA